MIILGNTANLPDPGAKGVTIGEGPTAQDIILVRTNGAVRAYVNRCPHKGTPLETFPNRFLNQDGTLLICSTHGARFRITDGFCVSGPCRGQSLSHLPVRCGPDGTICFEKQ